MARLPVVKLRHGAIEQLAGDAAVLQLRAHRGRAEKADTAPARRKIGADQLAVEAGAEARHVRRAVTTVHVIAIVPERRRIGGAEKSAECRAKNQRGFGKIVVLERTHDRAARIGRRARATRRHQIAPLWRFTLAPVLKSGYTLRRDAQPVPCNTVKR